jgi:hypothetical protein
MVIFWGQGRLERIHHPSTITGPGVEIVDPEAGPAAGPREQGESDRLKVASVCQT